MVELGKQKEIPLKQIDKIINIYNKYKWYMEN